MGEVDRVCEIWGVLNVTPDSFSDGGQYCDPEGAIEHGRRMFAQGADVVDVGGESTRPPGATYGIGAQPVEEEEELRRVLPVVAALVREGRGRVSVDTTKPAVAEQSLAAGASIINDVSCGGTPGLLAAVARFDAELVLMHSRDRGQVTTDNTRYTDVVAEVRAELMQAVNRAQAAGVTADRIWIDPGLGFAKTWRQSLRLLAHTHVLKASGFRVLVGPSRKSFIGEAAPDAAGQKPPPAARTAGTAVAVGMAVGLGASGIRVHDVRDMYQAARFTERLLEDGSGGMDEVSARGRSQRGRLRE